MKQTLYKSENYKGVYRRLKDTEIVKVGDCLDARENDQLRGNGWVKMTTNHIWVGATARTCGFHRLYVYRRVHDKFEKEVDPAEHIFHPDTGACHRCGANCQDECLAPTNCDDNVESNRRDEKNGLYTDKWDISN